MAAAQLGAVLRHIRKLAHEPNTSEQTDGALLRAFLDRNDPAAFEALVQRHGPMVLRVSQRTLGNLQDAEDALQATFLVLARKGASIRKRESLASWLHRVAYHMATHAKRATARRRGHESRVGPTQPRDPALTAAWQELQVLLDEAIQGLPETLREPFVSCCLENQGCAEAAQRLGLNEDTVRKRLSRARKLLRERLTRRGVSLAVVLAAAAVGANGASALPPPLVGSTVQAATRIAAGQAVAAGLVSTQVSALAEGVLQAMFLTKLRTVAGVLLALALAGTGTGILTYRTLAAGQPGGGAPAPASQTTAAGDEARIVKLIDQLGSSSFADREEATKELNQIGVPALDALRKAAQSDDLEQKKRASDLVNKIEGRALQATILTPKRVRLVYRDTLLAEAVADFMKQSGYELTLSDPQAKLKGRTITLDTGDVTFWQALGQFCQTAGVVEAAPPPGPQAPVPWRPSPINQPSGAQPAGDGLGESGIILIDGKALTLPTDDRTAVRVRAERAQTSDGRDIHLPLQITAEPKLRRLEIVAITIKEATDNQGQSLEPVSVGREAPPPPVLRPLAAWSPNPPSRQDPGVGLPLVRLKKGAKSATALSELSGTITARGLLAARPASKTVTFDIPFTLKDIPLP
jgi:RNA polymerase sigma factor (sigma-70 family)